MLTEALAALAMTASSRLVVGMAEDGWQELKERIGRLLGRGDPEEESRQSRRLGRSRDELVAAGGSDEARRRQGDVWRARFEDLLEEQPEAEADLRELIDVLGRDRPPAGGVQVSAQAFGQAQQAVQGQGVQTNTFSSRPAPPAPSP